MTLSRIKTFTLALTVLALGSTTFAQGVRIRTPGVTPSNGVRVANGGTSQGKVYWPKTRQSQRQHYQGRHRATAPMSSRQMRVQVTPHDSPSQHWYMGIQVARSPLGLMVQNVLPNSPAQRAGLEPGDYLLDAGGFIVGDYNGQHYPLSQAIDLGAESNGWIEMMVWNKRTFAQETLWVRLQHRGHVHSHLTTYRP